MVNLFQGKTDPTIHMQTICLKDFITTGKFGPVSLGMHIDTVIDILGEPEGITDYKNGHAEILYAYYEFFYRSDTKVLYGIQNDHLATFPNIKTGRVNNKKDICFTNDKFSIDIWFLKKNRFLTFKHTIDNLKKENIEFEVSKGFQGDNIIKFKSGVTLDFDDLSGMTLYDSDTKDWTWSEKIIDDNKKILNGIRLYDLSLT
jgi:hypothetical protein